ncbi:MAG: hypothetical protein US39_C0015G0018, partial [Microgenomates group bacterium GW2011_GWC1_37_12b]
MSSDPDLRLEVLPGPRRGFGLEGPARDLFGLLTADIAG